MDKILKKEEELNRLNKDVDDSLQELGEDNSLESYEHYEELLKRRLQLSQELYGMYRSRWQEVKSNLGAGNDVAINELIQQKEIQFYKTLQFGGTSKFLEKEINEQRSIQTTLSDPPYPDGDGEGTEEEGQ